MSRLKIREIKVVNSCDIDTYIRDAFGKEHILFPHTEKAISAITETTTVRKRSLVREKSQQEK